MIIGLSTVTLPQMRKLGTHLRNSLLNRSDHNIAMAAGPCDPSYHQTIGTPSKVVLGPVRRQQEVTRTLLMRATTKDMRFQKDPMSSIVTGGAAIERSRELRIVVTCGAKAHIHFHHIFVEKQTAGYALWFLPFMKLKFAIAVAGESIESFSHSHTHRTGSTSGGCYSPHLDRLPHLFNFFICLFVLLLCWVLNLGLTGTRCTFCHPATSKVLSLFLILRKGVTKLALGWTQTHSTDQAGL